jgi:hypothetical protein
VSAKVFVFRQATAMINGAGTAPEGKHHREHAPPPPAGAVGAGHARETTNDPP